LVTGKSSDITTLLSKATFLIIPVVNPDGYAYTWKSDRLWRKNRRNNGNTYGVDLNRNYPSNWAHGGSSSNPRDETYHGPSAASEPEVQAITRWFTSHTKIIAGLDLHSYSQLILRPIGWEQQDIPHERQHRDVGADMAEIIRGVHGKEYTNQKSIDLYPTTGSASDWFYLQRFNGNGNKVVRPYGMTIELRPTSAFWGPGFVLDRKGSSRFDFSALL
jgi:murein tripeptide amidase MpaA